MKKNIRYLSVLLLPLGCIGISNGFSILSIIIFLYYKIQHNCNSKNIFHEIIQNNIVKYSYLTMLFWILCIGIASLYNGGDNQTWAYFQRMLMFFIVIYYYGNFNDNKFFCFFWIGICLAAIILSTDFIYQFITLDIWRPNSSLLGGPNRLGGYLILILPFILSGTYIYNKFLPLGIISTLLILTALIISGSRGAIGGFIGAVCITYFILFLKKSDKRKTLIKTFVKIFLLTLFAMAVLYYLKPGFFVHGSDSERIFLWKSAIKMIMDYPIVGVGFGNFNSIYVNDYISPLAVEPRLTSPHNIFLHYFVNLGILGGISFIILIITQIYVLVKNINDTLCESIWILAGLVSVLGMVIHGMVDTMITTRPYALMYWLLYGIFYSQIVSKRMQ